MECLKAGKIIEAPTLVASVEASSHKPKGTWCMSKTNYSLACKHCGTAFNTPYNFKIYCSRKCKLADWKRQNPEKWAMLRAKEALKAKEKRAKNPAKPIGRKHLMCAHVQKYKMHIHNLSRVAEKKEKMSAKLCAECGNPVGYKFGRSRIFCAKKCLKQNLAQRAEHKETQKAARKKRKAIQRGAKVGQAFSYKQVFDRDGWRCQLCGKVTPERKRGTISNNAPEVDHIIPLSKGGEHSLNNVQTLCRACNGWKSDKIIPAQQGLFTGLLEGV
jgi:endogenous inhibitor of DNA gyrase (YacG/DUF329 family)